MVSIDELKQRFGPAVNVAPYGECIVIQGVEFDPDWEAELGDKGYTCHFTDLDGHAVTLVQLKKAVAEGKVVYVPPPKPAVIPEVHSNDVEVKETEKVEKRKYVLRGPAWTDEDEVELLKEHDRLVSEGMTRNFHKAIARLPKFKNRTVSAVEQKLKKLLRKRRKNEGTASPEVEKVASVVQGEQVEKPTSAREILRGRSGGGNMWTKLWPLKEDDLLVELWNKTPHLKVKDIFVEFSKKFSERSLGSVGNRLTGLQKEKRIQPRWTLKQKREGAKATNDTSVIKSDSAIKSPETTGAEKSEKSIEAPGPEVVSVEKPASRLDTADVLVDLVASVRMLIEANDSLNKAYVELKTKLNEQARLIQEILLANQCIEENFDELRRDLIRHKHADKTGEAMLPMEGSR